ncbi:MAG: putative anti-sigma factor [uncultured Cytophagales bacterium]|uniref:Putative anti-sigma factor n=1 Tax=uncultured Cytophagales bacterium TaxID=158755 RepID=A0A6J4HZU0_9SPHI|nr:MAG: putative anti-sigma factor [uncultured Cytophagales bacterium]
MKSRKKFKDAAGPFLSGNHSDEEKKALSEWQQNDPAGAEGAEADAGDLDDTGERMRRNIHAAIGGEETPAVPAEAAGRPLWTRTWVRAAAVLALAFGLAWLVQWYGGRTSVPALVVYGNPTGQPLRQTLPDGSIVWLSSHAQLTLAGGFNGAERTVFLKGEAFFKVAKNPRKPFAVHTGQVVARVLGTSFNVKTYATGRRVEVSVTEGKVSVQEARPGTDPADWSAAQSPAAGDGKRDVILLANQKVVFNGEPGPVAARSPFQKAELPEAEIPPAWKERALVFSNATVAEVVAELNGRFDAGIALENESLSHCTVKVDLSGRDLDTALRILCQLINAEYHKTGDKITLSGEGCPRKEDGTANE